MSYLFSLYVYLFILIFFIFLVNIQDAFFQEKKNKDMFCGVVSVVSFNFIIAVNL